MSLITGCLMSLCFWLDTIRYDSVYLTCSKKLTGSQLSLPHGSLSLATGFLPSYRCFPMASTISFSWHAFPISSCWSRAEIYSANPASSSVSFLPTMDSGTEQPLALLRQQHIAAYDGGSTLWQRSHDNIRHQTCNSNSNIGICIALPTGKTGSALHGQLRSFGIVCNQSFPRPVTNATRGEQE